MMWVIWSTLKMQQRKQRARGGVWLAHRHSLSWGGAMTYGSPDPDQMLPCTASVGVREGAGTTKTQPAEPLPETLHTSARVGHSHSVPRGFPSSLVSWLVF